jgi:hypothetical protein
MVEGLDFYNSAAVPRTSQDLQKAIQTGAVHAHILHVSLSFAACHSYSSIQL